MSVASGDLRNGFGAKSVQNSERRRPNSGRISVREEPESLPKANNPFVCTGCMHRNVVREEPESLPKAKSPFVCSGKSAEELWLSSC